MRPGLNAQHRIHPLYVLTCTITPSLQAEKGIERVQPAPRSPDLIFQDSDVVVFSGRSEAMVLHARVSGSRIRVGARVQTLGMQSIDMARCARMLCNPVDG